MKKALPNRDQKMLQSSISQSVTESLQSLERFQSKEVQIRIIRDVMNQLCSLMELIQTDHEDFFPNKEEAESFILELHKKAEQEQRENQITFKELWKDIEPPASWI